MSDIELELTFLAKKVPKEINNTKPVRVVDIYIPENPRKHARLRIRSSDGKFTLTKKLPLDKNDASKHSENTIALSQNEFNALIKASNRRIIKDRYKIVLAGHTAEVDIFKDGLDGLVIIDFEFNKESEKETFRPPSECLVDITQEDFIAGGQLAGKSFIDISDDLNRLGYKKL